MSIDLLYPTIFGLFPLSLLLRYVNKSIAILVNTICVGLLFYLGVVDVLGLLVYAFFFIIVYYFFDKKIHPIVIGIIVLGAVLSVIHQIPGFMNILYFANFKKSQTSMAFDFYMNLQQIPLISALFLLPEHKTIKIPYFNLLLLSTCACLVLMVFAYLLNFVRYDFIGIPPIFFPWFIKNIFYVCFFEELIYRYFLQSKVLPEYIKNEHLCLLITTLVFGLAHFPGGIKFIALASVAGLFYGYAYRLAALEGSIIIHFIVNFVWFIFFSYPLFKL